MEAQGRATLGIERQRPTEPVAPARRRRLRRPAPAALRVLAGMAVLVGVAVWSTLAWASAVRQVDVEQFHSDLAEQRVIAVEVVGEVREGAPGNGSAPWRDVEWSSWTADGSVDAPEGETALAYRTTDSIGGLRIVRAERLGVASAQDLADAARSAGSPVTGERVGRADPPMGWLPVLVVLGVLALVAAGPAPRWGTRWFWFWALFFGAPLTVVGYAGLELLSRRDLRSRPTDRARRPASGWRGVGVGVVVGIVIGLAVDGLRRVLGADVVP